MADVTHARKSDLLLHEAGLSSLNAEDLDTSDRPVTVAAAGAHAALATRQVLRELDETLRYVTRALASAVEALGPQIAEAVPSQWLRFTPMNDPQEIVVPVSRVARIYELDDGRSMVELDADETYIVEEPFHRFSARAGVR